MNVSPITLHTGDVILDPSFPASQARWVEVIERYRPDWQDQTQCLLVQDAMGNEYDVYVGLDRKVEVRR